ARSIRRAAIDILEQARNLTARLIVLNPCPGPGRSILNEAIAVGELGLNRFQGRLSIGSDFPQGVKDAGTYVAIRIRSQCVFQLRHSSLSDFSQSLDGLGPQFFLFLRPYFFIDE